jgi:hypothetical protein
LREGVLVATAARLGSRDTRRTGGRRSLTCSVWKVPFLPVMPWQMTLVSLLTKTAGGCVDVEDDGGCV